MSRELELFNESVGYESYFIINSLEKLGRISGIAEDFGISFVSHSYKSHTMHFEDNICENYLQSYIETNMLPLIFTSSFKILDMFIEYLIRINDSNPPRQFKQKVKVFETLLTSIDIPDEFEIKMIRCIFHLYKNLVDYRNMLIHGSWGKFENGKMIFKKDDKIFELSKEHILALSNIAKIIIKILEGEQDSTYMNGYKATLQRELNCFSDMFDEKFEQFPEMFITYHEIHYLLNEEDEEKIVIVEIMRPIESSLKTQKRTYPNKNFSIIFDVVVEKQNSMWRIPSNKLPLSCDEVQLSEFLNYKVN